MFNWLNNKRVYIEIGIIALVSIININNHRSKYGMSVSKEYMQQKYGHLGEFVVVKKRMVRIELV